MRTESRKYFRVNRRWLWLLSVPALGAVLVLCFVIHMASTVALVEESPGYWLAVRTLTEHVGVVQTLGGPVRVTDTQSKHVSKRLDGTTLQLTLSLEGSLARGSAWVVVVERGDQWIVERATIAGEQGQFGLLADGGLQPLYAPKEALASSP
ncbi:MAG TPA: hypothetical protein VM686_42640 [Polyangiaceae bacterium]|nr:hypothetical protein [Polyangiaceae bacterium]